MFRLTVPKKEARNNWDTKRCNSTLLLLLLNTWDLQNS